MRLGIQVTSTCLFGLGGERLRVPNGKLLNDSPQWSICGRYASASIATHCTRILLATPVSIVDRLTDLFCGPLVLNPALQLNNQVHTSSSAPLSIFTHIYVFPNLTLVRSRLPGPNNPYSIYQLIVSNLENHLDMVVSSHHASFS